jgi:hypothetical protein
MGLTVVGVAMSSSTSRVLVTLFEKHVEDFKLKPVDHASWEHKKPEYLKLQVIFFPACQRYLSPSL